MPRGGSRKGAGRPRKTTKAKVKLEKTFEDGSRVELGWRDGQLISSAAMGEYGAFQLQKLFDRLKAELPEYQTEEDCEVELPPFGTAATIALGEWLANDIANETANEQSIKLQ